MSKDECKPLLWDVESSRKAVPPTVDMHRVLQTSTYSNVNIPWCMVISLLLEMMLNCFVVYGSYGYMQSVYATFTPKCSIYEKRHEIPLLALCNATGFCFWTYPLLCALGIVLIFSRFLYESRLYYECLLHRILLNYDNGASTTSPLTWIWVVYGLLAMSVLFFVDTDHRTSRTMAMIYFAPVVSVFMVFLSRLQVESFLLPLPKFYETDPAVAKKLFNEAIFVNELLMRVAYEDFHKALDSLGHQGPLNSAEYFGLLAEVIKKLQQTYNPETTDAPPDAWYDKLLAGAGLVKVDESTASEALMNRPDVNNWGFELRKPFWAVRVLHSQYLSDDRSISFIRWGRVFLVCALVLALCILEVFISTGFDYFRFQREHVVEFHDLRFRQ